MTTERCFLLALQVATEADGLAGTSPRPVWFGPWLRTRSLARAGRDRVSLLNAWIRLWTRFWNLTSEVQDHLRSKGKDGNPTPARQTAITILRKLAELEQDPYGFSTTTLVSDPTVRRRRVGNYRVSYEIRSAELVVWVIHIAHRGVAYD